MPKHTFRKRTLRKKRATKKRRPRSRFRKRLSRRRRKTRRRTNKRRSRRYFRGGTPICPHLGKSVNRNVVKLANARKNLYGKPGVFNSSQYKKNKIKLVEMEDNYGEQMRDEVPDGCTVGDKGVLVQAKAK
jgi:hypothetical protein